MVIRATTTGRPWHDTVVDLRVDDAADPIAALDAMAHEAGYYDHGDIPDHLRAGGLSAEEVRI